MAFFQKPPSLTNLYDIDVHLQTQLRNRLPKELMVAYEPTFHEVGQGAVDVLEPLLLKAEAEVPRLIAYDPWGRRIDVIEVSRAWDELKAWSVRHDIVSTGYQDHLGAHARVVQTALLYLYSASSATFSCPLAMTDAAARVLIKHAPESLKNRLVPCLTSKTLDNFITSGQWMTERIGGSDVSQSETTATYLRTHGAEEKYALSGVKWFTSATTSEMALTLARIVDEHGKPLGEGLTLFCVELVRNQHGGLEGIEINRLKDKLGTRALPTAELTLKGAVATRVGPIGRGVASISDMLNITRWYNAVASASLMKKATFLAINYAKERCAFGQPIEQHSLHRQTLDGLLATTAGAVALCLELAQLLGKSEHGVTDEQEEDCLRVLTPITKLLLGKQAVSVASEALECFGGAGYIEDTGLPRLLRDAQVLPIWEGTTNVLSLDVMRAEKKHGAFSTLLTHLHARIEQLPEHVVGDEKQRLFKSVTSIRESLPQHQTKARAMAMATGLCLQAVLLAESGAQMEFRAFMQQYARDPMMGG